MPLYPTSLIIATFLATHGLRKGSLSSSGAIAAFLVGYGHLANPVKVFGVTLIFFYLAGSRATKVKVSVKAKLEDGPDPLKPGGNRNAIQVLSNCLPSLLAALYYRFGLSPYYHLGGNCPIDSDITKQLIYVALGQLATNFGDTLASELGILSTTPPRYILTGKTVPPGTNGGVSLYGLTMSAVGGGIIGLVMALDLLVESPGCRSQANVSWIVELVVAGTAFGFIGSLIDTVLGATLQQTLYSTRDSRILTDHSHRAAKEPGLKRIGIGRDILSNSAVNFISGAMMAVAGWLYASS